MCKLCDEDLYRETCYGNQTGFVRGKAKGPGLSHRAGHVTIRATMSDSYQPVLKVEV